MRTIFIYLSFFLFFSSALSAQIDLTRYNGVLEGQHAPASASNGTGQLTDNQDSTYWSVNQANTWVQYKAYSPFLVQSYALTAAASAPANDPTSWVLEGSKNGLTWVALDQQQNQIFAARGEKKIFQFANDSLFTYFRLTLTNGKANVLQLAEWNLYLPNAWTGFPFPTVVVSTFGQNLTPGEQVFFQVLNEGIAQQVCLGVNHILYQSKDEVPAFSKLNLIVDPNFNGIAGKGGNPPEIFIIFGANYLNNLSATQGMEAVKKEILGILYHEVTHAYTQEPKNSGPYADNTHFHTFIEGIADYVRYRAGYVPKSNRVPTEWWSGYNPAAFFMDWLNTKNPDFMHQFNLTTRSFSAWTWDKATRQILGTSVDLLWREYQVYLKNKGNNLIAEYALNNREVQANTPVTFTNLSANATGYAWSFPGGTPAVSTEKNPTVTYNQPGIYSVVLTATKGALTATRADTGYVIVGLKNFSKQFGINATNTPNPNEGTFAATDEIPLTKLLMDNNATTRIECASYSPVVIKGYVFQGNHLGDAPERFPASWKLKGSNDNVNWTVIDARENQQHPPANYGRSVYRLPDHTAPYSFYKFEAFTNGFPSGGDYLALSEVELYAAEIDTTLKDITDDGGTLRAQYQTGSPFGETYTNAIDNSNSTKYLTFHCAAWIQYQATKSYVAQRYSLVSGNDEPSRDPKNWTLQASNDGITWTTIDTRTNEVFASRNLERYFLLNNTVAYRYYRFNFTCNGASIFQISEIRIIGSEDKSTAVSVLNAPTALAVYPNPVNDLFTIKADNLENAPFFVHIYDVVGHLVQVENLHGAPISEINTEKLLPGIYQAVVTFRDRSRATVKVMKVE
jgi:PKD repeat protein